MGDGFGYLLVHHVEDPDGWGERIFFSLSDGDTPLRWWRANGGRPVLASGLGTTGVRDPYLVAGDGEWFVLATDLRIYGGDDAGWDAWTRHGSRSLVVWRSTDLVTWSAPWLLEVAPPTAGMAWAPEATYDPGTGAFAVTFSASLYDEDDPGHAGASYPRVLVATTRDFRTVSAPRVLIDRGTGVIDTTVTVHEGRVHRFSKQDADVPGSLRLFHEVGSALDADDFTVVASRIADDLYAHVEAPLVFRDHRDGTWYLWVDQYSTRPQGYVPLRADDLASGDWRPVPREELVLPPNTKHGVVVPLVGDQWHRLAAAYPA
ncbi:glycoside hydrolase family 43 protein [Cellulomonas oligotrophica]|uniref:Glycosyl hydrolase family 43 n=1 Tax=Cellulomonas oligotrophica TaxID=931536 RepID=A0A7Y9FFB8_9CELL|nr:glycoside hydrolase family 43 protein [Cellulomonas oligotrophica]NYD85962.1 hypothetical protein [Cellulomonas oligotrophica]GIG31030.1 hypothetical protein Col01nite_01890 [Cellulomonas oligotrophica]